MTTKAQPATPLTREPNGGATLEAAWEAHEMALTSLEDTQAARSLLLALLEETLREVHSTRPFPTKQEYDTACPALRSRIDNLGA